MRGSPLWTQSGSAMKLRRYASRPLCSVHKGEVSQMLAIHNDFLSSFCVTMASILLTSLCGISPVIARSDCLWTDDRTISTQSFSFALSLYLAIQ
jgi:hypothetical protein